MSDLAARCGGRLVLAAAVLALTPACILPDETEVQIRVESDPRAAPPDYLLFSWLDCRTYIQRDVRVPERGTLPRGRDPLATIVVRVETGVPTRRGALVRGYAEGIGGSVQVSTGAVVVEVRPRTVNSATVRLYGGAVPEAAGGIPEELDWCTPAPAAPPPVTAGPPPVTTPGDAGSVPTSTTRDAGASADAPLYPGGNTAPVVSAGADLVTPRAPADLTLTGTVTDDGRPGRGLAFLWSQVSGPAPATLSDAEKAVTRARLTAPGVYVMRLGASDGQLTGAADVTITVLSLDQGLVGLWHFDEGGGGLARDSSGGGLDATLTGGGAFTGTARLGRSALDCRGSGAQATVPVSALGRLELGAGDLTVATWVRSRATGLSDVVVKWPGVDNRSRHAGFVLGMLEGGAAQFKIFQGEGTTPVRAVGPVVTDGQWHHLLGRKTAGEMTLYVDGRRAATLPHGFPSLANDEPLQLGGFGGSDRYDLDGEADEVLIYTRALSDLEIAGLAAGQSP
jgi:hypothetical protein